MSTLATTLLARLDRSRDQALFYVMNEAVWPGTEPTGPRIPAPEGWTAYGGASCLAQVSGLAKRLASLGVGRGVPVAILSDTCHAWAAVDFATLCLGGITVGIYPSLLGADAVYPAQHAGAKVLVVQNRAQYDKVKPYLANLPALAHVVALEADAGVPQLLPEAPDEAFLRARAAEVQPDDIATLIYTSGTTGNPKGVILTHRIICETTRIVQQIIPMAPGESSIVALPFAHILQRIAIYQGLLMDVVGYYCPTLPELPKVLLLARPELYATVPRFLEKVRLTAEARVAERGPRALKMLQAAVATGAAYQEARRQGHVPLLLKLRHALADRLVLSKIRARLGGRMRLIVSGGAALNPDVNAWYEAIGIPVREVWGLTETCGPATLVLPHEWRPGTVGRAIPEVDLRLDHDGEVLVRGPNVFQGYFRDPDATAAAMTDDGYFRTGDIGVLDADGYLKIVDRKKELIVTAGGKNIAPVPIEKKLEGGLLGQAVVIGSERPFLVALFAPDPDVIAAWAKDRGWSGDYATLAAREEVRATFAEKLAEVNRGLPSFETVKKFAVLPAPLTPETGELTPTLKLKRRVIAQKYAQQIEAMYAGARD